MEAKVKAKIISCLISVPVLGLHRGNFLNFLSHVGNIKKMGGCGHDALLI